MDKISDFAGFPTYKASTVRNFLRRCTCVRERQFPLTIAGILALLHPKKPYFGAAFETSSLQVIDCTDSLAYCPVVHPSTVQVENLVPGVLGCFFGLACAGEVGLTDRHRGLAGWSVIKYLFCEVKYKSSIQNSYNRIFCC